MNETNPNRMQQKVEVVHYLRESAQNNHQKLMQVNEILEGRQPFAQKPLPPVQNTGSDKPTSKKSFLLRLFISSVLTVSVLAGLKSQDETAVVYSHKVKGIITSDYSQNLFDFIEKIPYTFEYEKINVKG